MARIPETAKHLHEAIDLLGINGGVTPSAEWLAIAHRDIDMLERIALACEPRHERILRTWQEQINAAFDAARDALGEPRDSDEWTAPQMDAICELVRAFLRARDDIGRHLLGDELEARKLT